MFVRELPCEPCVTVICCRGNDSLLAVLTKSRYVLMYPAQSQGRKEQCHPPPQANRRNTNRILQRQPPAPRSRKPRRSVPDHRKEKREKKKKPRYMVLVTPARHPPAGGVPIRASRSPLPVPAVVAPCSCHGVLGAPGRRGRVWRVPPPAMLAARMRCAGMRVKAVSGARADAMVGVL